MSDFLNHLADLCQLMDELLELEKVKLSVVSAGDTDALDSIMNEEQAFALKLRGLDKVRDGILSSMGQSGASISAVIETLEGEEKQKAIAHHEHLTATMKELKVATKASKRYIELQLHSIDTVLDMLHKQVKKPDITPPSRFKPQKV